MSLKLQHHLSLPRIRFGSAHPQLSALRVDNDELIQAIDAEKHTDEWDLNDVGADGLDQFWDGVESDLKKDPTWYTFSDE